MTGKASAWGCFELTGTHSVHLAPPSAPAHHPSSYDDTHFLAQSARPLLPPTVPSSPPPAPTSLLSFPPSSTLRRVDRVGFGGKKNAQEFFYRFHREAYFSLVFFSLYPDPPARRRPGFFFFFLPYLSTATVLCPDTAIFFHTGQSAAGLAEGRGQGKKRASRARPGGDSANHLSKQDRLFYSGVYFYFISFYFIFFFRCLMPPVRELFFSILTATFSVRWPFAARLSIQRFQNFARVNTHFSVSVLKYARLVHTINRVYSDCLCVQFITWIRPNRINMCCIIFTVIKNSYGFLINISYRCNLNIFLNR